VRLPGETVVRHPLHPGLADVVPYVSGIIDVDDTQGAGARLMGNIIDCDPDEVRVGDKVEVAFEPLSDDYAMMRFRRVARRLTDMRYARRRTEVPPLNSSRLVPKTDLMSGVAGK
jgi:hypothetical protein